MATANKRGPTKGSRILVKLPFGSNKNGGGQAVSQLVAVKQGVADVLGLKAVTKLPTKQVTFKTKRGTAKVTRLIQGSYRQRSVRLIFKSPKSIKGSSGTFKSVSLPLASGTNIDDVVKYFHEGAGKSRGVVALVTPAGHRIQWAEQTLSKK